MAEAGTSSKGKGTGARVAAGSGAILSLGASLVATATPAGAAELVVTSTADTLDEGTLRWAIEQANDEVANPGPDTITFAPGLGPITLSSGDLDIRSDITIVDPEGDVVIDGNGTSRIFYIGLAAADVTISGLELRNGDSGNGSAIRARGLEDLTITDTTLTGNFAGDDGGAIAILGNDQTVSVTISGVVATGNDAGDTGGALFITGLGEGSTVTIADSTFTGNDAADGGGGAALEGLQATYDELSIEVSISGSTFAGNTSDFYGGGLLLQDTQSAAVTVTTSTFEGNHSGHGGGILADNGGSLDIDSSTIAGNTADYFGGGIGAWDTRLTITSSTISGNEAEDSGGGIGLDDDEGFDHLIAHSTVAGNTARDLGGGLFVGGDGGTLTLDHDLITDNVASGAEGQAADGPVVDEIGSAMWVEQPFVQAPVALESVTLTNSLVNGSIAGEVVDGGGNLFEVPANLGPLANNGGPTQTHDLLTGSAALDAGDTGFGGDPATDQRGLPRVSNGRIDIGAVEVQVQEPVAPTEPTQPPAGPAQPVPGNPSFTG